MPKRVASKKPAAKLKKRPPSSPPAKAEPPADLGAARSHWDALLRRLRADQPDVEILWKDYAGKSGRQCVIRLKDRNLAYLKPGIGFFVVSMAMSDKAVGCLAQSKLPQALVQEIASSRKHPEGRAARVRVDSAATFRIAATLLAIKSADVLGAKSKGRAGPSMLK